jgi:hypothetical protein
MSEQLFASIAKAQGEFPAIPKDSEVEVKNKEGRFLYRYKYADLTTIINCTRPALAKHGLSITQSYLKEERMFYTRIMHESGHHLDTGFIPCVIQDNLDMKTIAGIVTYVKRISLTAALGVSADEDVDAAHDEASHGNTSTKERVQQGPKPSTLANAPKQAREPEIDDVLEKDPPNLPPHQKPNKPTTHMDVDDPGSYVITMGYYKGKTLGEVGVLNANKTIAYFKKLNKESGKMPTAALEQLEKMVAIYIEHKNATRNLKEIANDGPSDDLPPF